MGDWKPASFEEIVGHIVAGRLDLEAWSAALDRGTVARFLAEGREALPELPVPIGSAARGPAIERRRAIERLIGRLEARGGEYERLVEAERAAWLRGGPHLVYLRALRDAGREGEAAVLARTLLSRDALPDRAEVEEFLAGLSHAPEGWEDAVAELAEDPTMERWEALWRFTPEDVLQERVRYTLSLLLRFGVDPERVFELATWRGLVPDAIELVEKGLIEPKVVESQAAEAPVESRSLWLGLAARAACVRGDRLGTVRLLKAAWEARHDGVTPTWDLDFVREHADEELHDMLDRAGIPREADDDD